MTALDKMKQGPAIYLSLDLKTRNACADIDVKNFTGEITDFVCKRCKSSGIFGL